MDSASPVQAKPMGSGTQRPRLPTKIWYAACAVYFVLFALGGLLLTLEWVSWLRTGGQRFLAPGQTVFQAQAGQEYLVWQLLNGSLEGQDYPGESARPAGLRITVTESASREGVPVAEEFGYARAAGRDISYSLASFHAPRDGAYEVAVAGAFRPRVFSIFPPVLWKMVAAVLVGGFTSALGWIGTPVLLLWVFQARNRKPPQEQPAGRPGGELDLFPYDPQLAAQGDPEPRGTRRPPAADA